MFVVVIVYLSIKIFIFVLTGSDCFHVGVMTTQQAPFTSYGSYVFLYVVAVFVVVFFYDTEKLNKKLLKLMENF